jgi:hypothetical protein
MNKLYQVKLDEIQNLKWQKVKNKLKVKSLEEYVAKKLEIDYQGK